jgi:hypothetical protein
MPMRNSRRFGAIGGSDAGHRFWRSSRIVQPHLDELVELAEGFVVELDHLRGEVDRDHVPGRCVGELLRIGCDPGHTGRETVVLGKPNERRAAKACRHVGPRNPITLDQLEGRPGCGGIAAFGGAHEIEEPQL